MAGPRLKPPVSGRDHIQGRIDAPVTLVEYGDYECPQCGRAYYVIKQLQEVLGEDLGFVFRNFPLSQMHLHAQIAAEAAEAAGAQGKFWEMHDMLYENQAALEPEDLASYAEALGLDMEQFLSDLNEGKFANRVSEDFQSGLRSGVNGTPTMFINGLRRGGTWGFETLLNELQIQILAARDKEAA